jgi:uncharacterized short protein YbdD (DUF466 family)
VRLASVADRPATSHGVVGRSARAWRGLRWYVRELTGEAAYDRYVAHARRQHPGLDPMPRAEWWRARQDAEDSRPQQRCC